jgi:hypothetical protein
LAPKRQNAVVVTAALLSERGRMTMGEPTSIHPDYYRIEVRQRDADTEYGGSFLVSYTLHEKLPMNMFQLFEHRIRDLQEQMDNLVACDLTRWWYCYPGWWSGEEDDDD